MLYINDLIKVGEEKIIGYLPLNTIEMDGFKISELTQFARDKGLSFWHFYPGEVNVFSGAFYLADMEKLQKYIELPEFDVIFKDNYIEGLERTAESLMDVVIYETIYEEDKPELYKLIALIFKDGRKEFAHRDAIKELKQLES